MFSEVKKSTNIPYYFQSFNIELDVKTTMDFLEKRMPPLLSHLAKEFRDATGQNSKVAWGFLNATNLYMARCSNQMMHKITFCKFKGQNVLKVSEITTATAKIHLYCSFQQDCILLKEVCKKCNTWTSERRCYLISMKVR